MCNTNPYICDGHAYALTVAVSARTHTIISALIVEYVLRGAWIIHADRRRTRQYFHKLYLFINTDRR